MLGSCFLFVMESPIDMELASSSSDEDHCSSVAAHPKKKMPSRVYEFTGLDYWTGLLDWTTGLIKKWGFTPF